MTKDVEKYAYSTINRTTIHRSIERFSTDNICRQWENWYTTKATHITIWMYRNSRRQIQKNRASNGRASYFRIRRFPYVFGVSSCNSKEDCTNGGAVALGPVFPGYRLMAFVFSLMCASTQRGKTKSLLCYAQRKKPTEGARANEHSTYYILWLLGCNRVRK